MEKIIKSSNLNYKFILGDSFLKLKQISDNSIDLIVTDPPYGINLKNNLIFI